MSEAVAFIQECLSSERERNSSKSSSSQTHSSPHTLVERQWTPISSTRQDKEIPLALCWDHSGLYCAEGNNAGNLTIWNFTENTTPYNALDRRGGASFRAALAEEFGGEGTKPPVKSACIAWSDTCHHIYMASNFTTTACHISCWSVASGDEMPIHTSK